MHKTATCCYCGSHTVLTFKGHTRHELQCTACGAPLRRMKSLRADHVIDPFTVNGKQTRHRGKYREEKRPQSRKKSKKSIAHRFFDVAEDVVEEIFDIFD